MERTLYGDLVAWKHSSSRKPLIIRGVRQVGKTWLMKEFGKREYKNYVYVNFDRDAWAKDMFVQDYDINRILLLLQAYTGIQVVAGETLIIFDEIQEAKRGLGALKYFCEEAPQHHVVAAGSLLGIAMHSMESFPVGKVNVLTLYPMTFAEFLMAVGNSEMLKPIKDLDWETMKMLDSILVDKLRTYYFVGGMPEAVQSFVSNQNFADIRRIQSEILTSYRNDIGKHAPKAEVPRINMVLDSIPSQLAKENKKFIYGALKHGARSKDFEMAIQWLIDAGIVYKVNRVSEAKMPLKFYEDITVFKLFLADCGLMGCLADAPIAQIVTKNEIFSEYKGAFTENYVLAQLKPLDIPIYYWSSNSSQCEIDFLVQAGLRIVPLEVKAEENVRSQSLSTYCKTISPDLKGLRCSMKPYIDQGWMENIPLYSVEAHLKAIADGN